MGEVLELDRRAHQLVLAKHEQLLTLARQVAITGLQQTLAPEAWVPQEEYSHSLHLLDEVGGHDVNGTLQTPEGKVAQASLRECFDSSIIEMLHTDRDSRRKLEINRERRHIIHNGQVMAHDGKTPMAVLCKNGAASAAQEALTSKPMEAVATRCAADVRNALAVDKLPVGGLRVGVSNYPKEAMAQHGTKFYEDLGFREGIAFLQWYYRMDEHTVIEASYSVDDSDIETMRQVWAAFGGHIPEGTATDTWLDYAIERQCTEQEARELVVAMRQRFYQLRGIHIKRYSVDEFMALNQAAADEMFGLYRDLARAYHGGTKSTSMQTLVAGLLQNPRGLHAAVRQQLSGIYRGARLDRDSTALLEQLIRYATAERLREGLQWVGVREQPVVVGLITPPGMSQMEFIASRSAGNILAGARAGRTYGGCTRSINLSENPDYESSVDPDQNPQEAYGGNGRKKRAAADKKVDICVYTHTNCYCCRFSDNLELLDEPMKVEAKKRPGFVECLRPGCGAYMTLDASGNPKKIEKGAIYAAAEEKRKKAARLAQEAALRGLAARVLQPHSMQQQTFQQHQAREKKKKEET